ncbi:ABC transporter substrate-binding protein [Microbacterium resistens]|uniref:ABC transporter substrate-binding protein n=1 Tax=Microbacterium resistens TaxID=156977 RepID=A0ABY3RRH3_9MICO|nr:ABC transporter substrate-binding protein [Microbacterium resistens]UGS25470.1 ABC transporter substrate-binding protein [Microbacterium resistens]
MNTSGRLTASRWAAALGATVVGAGLLAGCAAGGGGGGGSASDELYIAVQDDPVCLDPQQVTLTTALNIGRQLVDSLVDQDPETGEIVPWLAESYEADDTLTAFTFTLRDDVTFSDGSALTPETVKANFDALAALGTTAALASQYLAGYQGTEIVDDATVRVTFAEPNAQFLQGASTITLGLLSDASAALSAEERCQSPVGSGPFVLDTYTSNDSVVLTAREGYGWASELREHEGDAAVKTVTFAVTPEPGVRTGGLQTGEFDMILDLPAADEARFGTEEFQIFARANPGVPHSLVPNTERPVVSDPAVRRAMILATDRAEISELTGSGHVDPATGVLSSATPSFLDQADALKTDLDAAKKLLDDAGWKAGADGVREKDGTPLRMTVTAFYGQDVLEAAQAQLAKAGIDLQIAMVTSGDFFGAVSSRDYDFLGAGLTRTDPDVLRVMFSAESAARWAVVADLELDAELATQAETSDPAARADLLGQAQTRILDQAYLVPLLQVAQVHAAQKGVTGVAFDSSSRIVLYDATVER